MVHAVILVAMECKVHQVHRAESFIRTVQLAVTKFKVCFKSD